MALVLADRVKETSTSTGTGTYDLDGPVTGFQGFVVGVGNGNTTYYAAINGTDWEVGIGTVTDAAPDTLARTTILASSNSDAAVNWGAGTKTLFCTLPALKAIVTTGTVASSATPTPDINTDDVFTVTALAVAATFGAPTGTPVNGQKLIIRIKDDGTARSLAWNAIYRAGSDVALPTTTVISKTMYLGFIYNSTDTKWDLVAFVDNI